MLMVVVNIYWLCLSADAQNLKKVNYFKKNTFIINKSLHIVMKKVVKRENISPSHSLAVSEENSSLVCAAVLKLMFASL